VSVQRGEAVGLLGPNGAGKTTCFYIITGLIRADVGRIDCASSHQPDRSKFVRQSSKLTLA